MSTIISIGLGLLALSSVFCLVFLLGILVHCIKEREHPLIKVQAIAALTVPCLLCFASYSDLTGDQSSREFCLSVATSVSALLLAALMITVRVKLPEYQRRWPHEMPKYWRTPLVGFLGLSLMSGWHSFSIFQWKVHWMALAMTALGAATLTRLAYFYASMPENEKAKGPPRRSTFRVWL